MLLVCLQETQSYSQSVFYRPPDKVYSHMIFVECECDTVKDEIDKTTYVEHMEKNFTVSDH